MAQKNLTMKIVAPTGILFEGEVLHAQFPGTLGEFAVFPAHAPLISNLHRGEITYTTLTDEQKSCTVGSGFVEVNNDKITVCIEQ